MPTHPEGRQWDDPPQCISSPVVAANRVGNRALAPKYCRCPGSLLHLKLKFSIPESLDDEKVIADISNGIMTMRVPKAESAKPRKIEIKVA
ncbi:MAG TPA: Hsp20 family protein [Geobacteraceae bacterium]|nr:Hsp20 family protein [Geobacteraceae bacterium]